MDKADFIVWVSKLQASYTPSEETQQRISQVELIAVVGPTGVGKSTLIHALDIPEVLSHVTRDPRPGEKNGKDYHFENDYLKIIEDIKQGRYVQFLISSTGEFYGTHVESYPQSGHCIMAVYADAVGHFREIGFKQVTQLYIMPPSYIEWMHRIGDVRAKDLLGRIGEARKSILLAVEDDQYSFILNDTIESAKKDILASIGNGEINQRRTDLARGTADILLERIGDEL